MKANDIVTFLGMIRAQKIKIGTNGWVHSSCPLAAWNHSGGYDSRPSFGIAIANDTHSGYKCHGCNAEGALPDLVMLLQKRLKKNMSSELLFVKLNDDISAETLLKRVNTATGSWQDKQLKIGGVPMNVGGPLLKLELQEEAAKVSSVTEEDFLALPKEFPADVLKYLTDPRIPLEERDADGYTPRGLTRKTLDTFEVRWNPEKSKVTADKKIIVPGQRIITPIRDVEGKLVSLSGRSFYKWTKPKFIHSSDFSKQLYLYGEYQCTKGEVGYLVEGQFDVQMLHQHGYTNTVAVMGSSIGPVQIEKLTRFYKRLVYVRDGDKAGREAEERIRAALHARMPITSVVVPEGYDPDDFSAADLWELLGDPPAPTTPF
jgi:hypothetical protein